MSHTLTTQGERGCLHCLTEKTAHENGTELVFLVSPLSWYGGILGVYDKALQVIEGGV
jgi:hypothetical protein